jgi:hypothetical protein
MAFYQRPKSPRTLLLATALVCAPTLLLGPDAIAAQDQTAAPPFGDGNVVIYFLDHQFLPAEEVDLLRSEVSAIFGEAGLTMEWVIADSPRRKLNPNELRLIILPSDGTRWFHGPSNVIGIAPHDDAGTGKNCFVFYRQAIWFRQQAVFRCREAIQARTEAQIRGVEVDPFIESYAPADCGDYLPSLTALIVARAAAHEMVHILLNKLDHSPGGLMRNSFHISDWFTQDNSLFRLDVNEIQQLRLRLVGSPNDR